MQPSASKPAQNETSQIPELLKSLDASQKVTEVKLTSLEARVALIESFNSPRPPRKRNK